MMEFYILDRFEEGLAVIEATDEQDKTRFFTLEKSLLPKDAEQGDVLENTKDGWSINRQETERRRERIRMLMRQFRN